MAEGRARIAAHQPAPEAALAARWAAGLRGPLRLEDGRRLRVIFPGVPGGASGPDFRDGILDAGGDYLKGDIEVHTLASGWRAHGHHLDPAYRGVVLHVVGVNDTGAACTLHGSGRAIGVLVLGEPAGEVGLELPGFVPPCALAVAQGSAPGEPLERLARRRLRMKAARLGAGGQPGQLLYQALLATLGGPANREAFAALAWRMPLAALLERAAAAGDPCDGAIVASLVEAGRGLRLERGGARPAAAPARRLEAAGALVARLWPAGAGATWPATLARGCPLPGILQGPGIGRGTAIELAVNAVLPVAFATGMWGEAEVMAQLAGLPSPGTYGKLRRLEGWLGGRAALASAGHLQGALLLHSEYCSRGMCGRCPLSS